MSNFISDADLQKLIRQMGVSPSTSEHPDPEQVRTEEEEEEVGEGGARVQANEIVCRYGSGYQSGDVTVEGVFPVRLIVNGTPVSAKAALDKGDRVTWEIVEQPMFDIRVTPDAMKAYLHIRKTERSVWSLADTDERKHLLVKAVEQPKTIVETLSSAAIITQIHQMGISYNLNLPMVIQEHSLPTFEPVLIAAGDEPIPSRDAELQLFFAEKVESVLQEYDGTVDFKNHLQIPQAQAGEVIARKIAAGKGSNGCNVYNQPVVPEPPLDIPIREGRHVKIKSNGEIIALKSGRPKLSGERAKCFEITTEFTIYGDVGIESGNIIFSGDVIVYGNVLEGMIIESTGNVYIFGNVYSCTITATGSIYISGNVTASSLYSGYFGVVFNRLYTQLRKLTEELEQLTNAAAMLSSMIQEKGMSAGIGHIVLTLVQTKFTEMPRLIRETLTTLTNVRKTEDNNWEELCELRELLGGLTRIHLATELDSLDSLLTLMKISRQTYETIEAMQENKVVIEFAQCNGSTVKSNGDIIIFREGSFQSRIFAREGVFYKHEEAVCRGGEIEAGGPIQLMSVGGVSGGEALIRTHNKISANRIYLAKINIGKHIEYIQEPLQNVNAYLERGRLVIIGEAMN